MAKQSISRLTGILRGNESDAPADGSLSESKLTRLERCAYFCAHVWDSFVRNRCLVRAAALSFSTLLALIPMLVVAIGVASSFYKSTGEDEIYGVVNKFVSYIVPPAKLPADTNASPAVAPDLLSNPMPTGTNSLAATNFAASTVATNDDGRVVSAQREAAKSIHEFVKNTRSGELGAFGMLALVWVAISMLANIEATFNDIWGVTRGRSWFWRIFVYWTALTLGPFALIGAYSIIGIHMAAARQAIGNMPVLGELISQVVPVTILWLLFSLIYVAVPNIKVRWRAAAVGGLVAAILWHFNNLLGYLYVSRFATSHMIYGSIGLVPVFMAGLYFTWAILLFGVQVSYAWQNREAYLQDKFAENVNQRGREFIALRLMTCLGVRYQIGEPPAPIAQVATDLGISTRLTQQVMQTLQAARLVTEVAGPEMAYCPARPLDAINAHQVLLAVRAVNKPVIFTREEPVRDEIYGEFARIEEAERAAAASVTMAALVNRARAKLAGPVIGPACTALALPEITETVPVELTVIAASEKTMEPETAPVPGPAPEKPPRRIAVPEDNHDFPL